MTESLQDPRILRIIASALKAVEPDKLVRHYLETAELPKYHQLYLLGIGKAAEPMTLAAADLLDDFARGLIITKHSSGATAQRTLLMEAGHPIPDERSLAAGNATLDFVSSLNEDDLLICLISGGGSSLVTVPHESISLADMQMLTRSLLASGATIGEINILRRRLDRVKAGGLVRATKAKVICLILSDVIGDRLEVIASGLTAPIPAANADAQSILEKYSITPEHNLYSLLSAESVLDDTPIPRVQNIIIGNNRTAAQAAEEQAERVGFGAELIIEELQGEARIVGQHLAETLATAAETKPRPFCLIAGGETTVTLRGNGKGGRNQELALSAVNSLDGLEDVVLIALATDGDDGPTDAAGAVATGKTYGRAARLGMSAADYLARNDSYPFFAALGDLLRPGYTGTNVNDLLFLMGL